MALTSMAFSQEIVGKAYTVSTKPIVETTAQIMQRERQFGPKLPIRVAKSLETEHEIDRDHLPQNPLSPASPVWPPMVNDITPSGGKIPPPPYFGVAVDFGGPVSAESPYVPPDTDGDVSLSSVMVQANGRIKSYDRLGNAGVLNVAADTFFASVRSSAVVDPRIVFDRISKRWIIEQIDVTSSNNRICLAVSSGEAITGSTTWTFFQFAQNIGGGVSGFADYATLGVDANGVYIGTNRFTSSFQNCDLFAINKASLLAGTLTVTPFRNLISSGTGMFTPWPATNDDPSATVAFVVGADAGVFGKLDYRRVTFSGGTFSLSGNASITVPTTANPLAMPIPTSASTVGAIDSLDDRLFYARVCRNRLTGEVNVTTAHGIRMTSAGVGSGSGDRSGGRWYTIGNVFSGTATLINSGTVVDGAGSGFKFCTIPSASTNGQGHQFIGFTMGNSTNSPGIGGAYRLSTDSLVTGPTLIDAGANYYAVQGTTGTQRWGDYSFTMVDPRDMMSIWTFQEYCNANNSWQVRGLKILAPAPTVSGISPSSVNQSSNLNVVVTGTGIFDPDSTYPDHLAFSFGANITVNTVTWNSDTQATVNITVGSTAATGTRQFTLTNPDGQVARGNITVNSGLKTVSGTLALTSYTGSVTGLQFVYELRDASTNALIETHNITGLGSGNTFSFTTSQAAGNYKLRIKGVNRFLAKSMAVTLSSTGVSGLSYTLANGDCDGSNVVGTADFNILRAAWGAIPSSANWNEAADLNGDGVIGTADFNIMRADWGGIGDS
ncbi:MAG: hypothetical protein JST51_08205 [Armatimonadetes bacterium]|nr:hypothetical protein [Armatimonadota bacterium]